MSANFTPGPWARSPTNEHVVGPDGARVATPWIGTDHWQANSDLIIAAPKLYALLEELIDLEGPCPGNAAWANKVEAALAEARGEQVPA